MKSKSLLALGLALLVSASAQAQILSESFDSEQTKSSTDVGYYEFINTLDGDLRELNSSDAYSGQCINFYNAGVEGSWWQRAIKFRNLTLEEGKSYRLSFKLKGSDTYNLDGTADVNTHVSVALMQGVDNADIALIDANGNEQRYEISSLNPDSYETYTRMFYYASAEQQQTAFAAAYPDLGSLQDTYFATINVYDPGDFYLDDVSIVESSIQAVQYSADVIRVDFGYDTNIKTLVAASSLDRVIMPTDCVSVTLNGETAAVDAVELQSDGYLYIFLTQDNYPQGTDDEVVVSFTNPDDASMQLVYASGAAMQGTVQNFSGETATYLEGLEEVASWAYTEPQLVSSEPSDGSFAIDETTNSVTFTFDKAVLTTTDSGEALTALLNGSEQMDVTGVQDAEGKATGLKLTRKDGKTFTKGSYTVTLYGVTSELYIMSYETFSVSFETGAISLATETKTPIATYDFTDDSANTIPVGWTVNNEGEIRESGSSQSSGPRVFSFTNATDITNALYLRAALDDDGVSKGGYAMMDEAVTLPAGELRIDFKGFCWKGSSLGVDAEILDETGTTVVAHQTGTYSTNVDGSTSASFTCDNVTVPFTNTAEGNYRFRLTLVPSSTSWIEVMFGGVVVNTYSKTEGDSSEAEVVFEDATYGGPDGLDAEDNCAPKTGSGWELYQDGVKRTPGASYNYNGSRIFALSIGNLSMGYYTNYSNSWPYNYIIYGTGGDDGTEPLLHLESGSHQITYYAANWKENSDHAGVDHIVYFQLANKEDGTLIVDREDQIVDCDMDGSRSASVSAKKIQFTVTVPEEADYTLKTGATTEQFIGNFTIEKLGSQGAYYYSLVNAARDLALAELENSADEKYDGTVKTALQASVDKYADLSDIHTADQVSAAVTELETLTEALSTRREYVARYDAALTEANTLITDNGEVESTDETEGHAATKYAGLDVYAKLQEVYNTYAATASKDMENDILVTATEELENCNALFSNLCNTGIALLTKQIVNAAATLVSLDDSQSTDETVLAAGNALTDDQSIAKALELQITKTIYEKIAAGEDLFSYLHETYLVEVEDSIDLSGYIRNAELYTLETSSTRNLTDVANLPGWNLDQINGTPGIQWSWSTWSGSETNPVNDQFLLAGWNTEWNLYQTIENLPVGQYRYVASTQDRGFADTSDSKVADMNERAHWTVTGNSSGESVEGEILSNIWWQTGEVKDSVGYVIESQGQYYDLSDCASKVISVAANGDSQMGELTIGSHAIEYQAYASTDNFRIYLIGKDDSFDYAAAAKAVEDEITAVVSVESPEGEPVSVRYYDLNGQLVNEPQGITIKVATYKNGYMKVTKYVAQ